MVKVAMHVPPALHESYIAKKLLFLSLSPLSLPLPPLSLSPPPLSHLSVKNWGPGGTRMITLTMFLLLKILLKLMQKSTIWLLVHLREGLSFKKRYYALSCTFNIKAPNWKKELWHNFWTVGYVALIDPSFVESIHF